MLCGFVRQVHFFLIESSEKYRFWHAQYIYSRYQTHKFNSNNVLKWTSINYYIKYKCYELTLMSYSMLYTTCGGTMSLNNRIIVICLYSSDTTQIIDSNTFLEHHFTASTCHCFYNVCGGKVTVICYKCKGKIVC